MHLKQCEIVCDVDKLKVDIQETCMKYKTIKEWAYINHDKDDTRPHYHIYLNFGVSSVDTSVIATWFQVADNFVSRVKGRKADMLMYLTHGNDTQKNKHQYSVDEVHANFDFETEIENSKIIGDFKTYSYAEQLKYIASLPISEKSKAFTQLKKLWELECQTLCLETDRDMQVVFITGKGGSGKTTYAKKMLEKLGYDYCISSSSNDPFQDYLGQKAIILDDLRDRSFELEDLLKLLDNNTRSSVKSRFNNKVFNGKMIVITSSVPLCYWYSKFKSVNSIESLDQLYRRIGTYIEVSKTMINVFDDGVDEKGKGKGTPIAIFNELSTFNNVESKKVKISDILSEVKLSDVEKVVS